MLARRMAGVVVGAGRQGHAQHRHHHVAGPGDVVDLPRPGREDLAPAVAVGQGHAFLVERDDGRFQVEPFAQLGRGLQRRGRVVQHAAGGQAGFQAVGRDRRAAVILAIIAAANRVGQHACTPQARAAAMTAASSVGVQTPLS